MQSHQYTLQCITCDSGRTSISSHSDSCSALSLRSAFPAFVTNTVGTRNFPVESTNRLNASRADGSIRRPRTITPSMSNNNPKSGTFLVTWNRVNQRFIYTYIMWQMHTICGLNLYLLVCNTKNTRYTKCFVHAKQTSVSLSHSYFCFYESTALSWVFWTFMKKETVGMPFAFYEAWCNAVHRTYQGTSCNCT